MTTKVREYRTKVPYSVHEWRKGQRYVLAKYTTDDVQILDIKQRKEEGSIVTETRKILNMSKWLPGVVRKILNENAMFVEEFSTNIDVIRLPSNNEPGKEVVVTEEKLKTKGLLREMDVETVQEVSGVKDSQDPLKDIKPENLKDGTDKKMTVSLKTKSEGVEDSTFSTISSSCETSYVNKHYDPSTFALSIKTLVKNEEEGSVFQAEGSKVQVYDLAGDREPFCYVYKLITVTINSMVFGWVADKIKNSVRDMLAKFHEKVIETEKEWKDIKEEDLLKLEEEMVKKFMKI